MGYRTHRVKPVSQTLLDVLLCAMFRFGMLTMTC